MMLNGSLDSDSNTSTAPGIGRERAEACHERALPGSALARPNREFPHGRRRSVHARAELGLLGTTEPLR